MHPAAGPITGIDLGTTMSSIAFLNAFGRAEVIPTVEGEKAVPSVVLFEPGSGKAVVGREAKERSIECPDRVVEFVKREMGDPDWSFPIDGRELRPEALSALVLKKLIGTAETALGHRPRSAVITCPAYFGDLEREATAQAGALAGLEVQAVFNEPTAAALAYGLHHAAKDERVLTLVYDLGGGTFDVTVLELRGRRVKVLATAGEHRLGGKDWDDELLNFVAEEFQVEFGKDPRDDMAGQQDLRNRCEAAKVVLSRKSKAKVFCRAYGETLKVEVTRGLFEELTRPLLLQTRTYLDEVLSRAKVGWDQIDVVLPVGGSSHMPQVRNLLTECMGRAPEVVVDPDLAVVQGAAYYAALLRAEEGFQIKCFAVRQPTGRLAKKRLARQQELAEAQPAADVDEALPALPPATMDDAPELLALPGQVGPSPGKAKKHRTLYAIPALPGAAGPQRGAKVGRRSRPAAKQGRPPKRPSGRPPKRPPKRRPPPKKRPSERMPLLPAAPRMDTMAGGFSPDDPALDTYAMGISPDNPQFDFADIVILDDIAEEPVASLPGQTRDSVPGPPPPLPPPRQSMVQQVNARALGVLVHKKGVPRTSVMIESNSSLPAHKRSRFYTINDDQSGVKVVVLEGDDPNPESCKRIGECVVSGLPPRPKGQPIEIGYSYDEDGRICIWAMDLGTGKQAEVELKRQAALTNSEFDEAATWINGVFELGG